MLIVTLIDVVIGRCLPVYLPDIKISKYGISKITRSQPWSLGSCDVIGHMIIRLAVLSFLGVVHSDHVSI